MIFTHVTLPKMLGALAVGVAGLVALEAKSPKAWVTSVFVAGGGAMLFLLNNA